MLWQHKDSRPNFTTIVYPIEKSELCQEALAKDQRPTRQTITSLALLAYNSVGLEICTSHVTIAQLGQTASNSSII